MLNWISCEQAISQTKLIFYAFFIFCFLCFHFFNRKLRLLLQPDLWQWLRIRRLTQTFLNLCVHNFRGSKRITIFKHAKFCLAVRKVQWNKGGRQSIAVWPGGYAWLIGSIVLEFRFQLDCLSYTYIVDYIYTEFWLVQNLTCIRPSRA